MPGFLVNQGQAVGGQDSQLAADVVHIEGQVVQALAAPGQEAADGAFRGQGLQQFQAGLPDFDQAGAHGLVVQRYYLGVRGAEVGGEKGQGGVNIVDGHADVVNVVDGANWSHCCSAPLPPGGRARHTPAQPGPFRRAVELGSVSFQVVWPVNRRCPQERFRLAPE